MARYKKRADGRYHTTIGTNVVDPETGKKIRISVYGRSISELEQNKARVMDDLEKGIYVFDRTSTFGKYKWTWLNLYKAGREENTIEGYRNILKNHTGCLDNLKLIDIRKSDVQAGYNALNGHDDLQRRYYQTVNQILRAAIDDGLIYKNVAMTIEKARPQRKKKRALTDRERNHLDTADFDDQEKLLAYLLLYTGLRRQEIIPLSRFDVNFAKGKIYVNKAVKFVGEKAVLKETKTVNGEREVYILDPLLPLLKAHMTKLRGNLLFPGPNDAYLSKTQYRLLFERVKRKLNIACGGSHHWENGRIKFDVDMCKGLGSHTFRHEYATMLYYSGIDILEAVEMMGHSNSRMILDTYAELRRQERDSRDKINAFLSKTAPANKALP